MSAAPHEFTRMQTCPTWREGHRRADGDWADLVARDARSRDHGTALTRVETSEPECTVAVGASVSEYSDLPFMDDAIVCLFLNDSRDSGMAELTPGQARQIAAELLHYADLLCAETTS